jgi:hypothetical protein
MGKCIFGKLTSFLEKISASEADDIDYCAFGGNNLLHNYIVFW